MIEFEEELFKKRKVQLEESLGRELSERQAKEILQDLESFCELVSEIFIHGQ